MIYIQMLEWFFISAIRPTNEMSSNERFFDSHLKDLSSVYDADRLNGSLIHVYKIIEIQWSSYL